MRGFILYIQEVQIHSTEKVPFTSGALVVRCSTVDQK